MAVEFDGLDPVNWPVHFGAFVALKFPVVLNEGRYYT